MSNPISGRRSISEFDSISQSSKDHHDDSHISQVTNYSSAPDVELESFDTTYSRSLVVPELSVKTIEAFKDSHYSLRSSSSNIRYSGLVRNKYDLNWLSVDDYFAHWSFLSLDEKVSLRMLCLSSKRNRNSVGLKKRNLDAHLLLHLGCDMTNILNSGSKNAIVTNLKSPTTTLYSSDCVNNRVVDPKTCVRAYQKFKKTYDVDKLFKMGLVAYQAVISSDSSYRSLKDAEAQKERYLEFFKENTSYFSWLSNKSKKICSYIYSHEVSVDSITDGKYRPHTHVIFFLPKGSSYEAEKIMELESKFNSEYLDRKMSFVCENDLPSPSRTIEDIETSISYFCRAYSLADQYLREVTADNIPELNRRTVECYRMLVWLGRSDEARKDGKHVGRKTVKRFNHSKIPKVGEASFKLPLLQKNKKQRKIKKSPASALK